MTLGADCFTAKVDAKEGSEASDLSELVTLHGILR